MFNFTHVSVGIHLFPKDDKDKGIFYFPVIYEI